MVLGDIRLVQWLLGHENISSTVIYLKLIDSQDVIGRWGDISPLRGVA